MTPTAYWTNISVHGDGKINTDYTEHPIRLRSNEGDLRKYWDVKKSRKCHLWYFAYFLWPFWPVLSKNLLLKNLIVISDVLMGLKKQSTSQDISSVLILWMLMTDWTNIINISLLNKLHRKSKTNWTFESFVNNWWWRGILQTKCEC